MVVAYVVLAIAFASGYVTCWLFCAGLGWLVGVLAVLLVMGFILLVWWDKRSISPVSTPKVGNTAMNCHCELE